MMSAIAMTMNSNVEGTARSPQLSCTRVRGDRSRYCSASSTGLKWDDSSTLMSKLCLSSSPTKNPKSSMTRMQDYCCQNSWASFH